MTGGTYRRAVVPALAADIACIAAFTALGRRNHQEAVSLAGVAETAWPFLTGAAIGWLVSRGWRRPVALSTGITVWVCAVAVGMVLRRVTSAGTAPSFVLVATLATGVLLLGWRAAVGRAEARRAKASREGYRRSRSGS